MASLCHIKKKKKKIINKFHKNCCLKTSFRPFSVCSKICTTSRKMKLLKQVSNIRYVLAKLSKFVQISTQTSWDCFLEDSLKIKKGLGRVSRRHFFIEFCDEKISFVMLHRVAKFRHQTMFTSQVLWQNLFLVSCLGIWWRHKIWISERLKSDYLKNKKSS